MRDARSGLHSTTVISSSTRQRMRNMSLNTPMDERNSTSIRVTAMDRPDQVVEYTLIPSSDHDLFQFGRDPCNNDFHIPGHTIEGHTWYQHRDSLILGIRCHGWHFGYNAVGMIIVIFVFRQRDLIMRMNCFWDRMLCDGELRVREDRLVVLMEVLLLDYTFGSRM